MEYMRRRGREINKLQEENKREGEKVLRKTIRENRRKTRRGVTLDAKSCYMVTAQANRDVVQ